MFFLTFSFLYVGNLQRHKKDKHGIAISPSNSNSTTQPATISDHHQSCSAVEAAYILNSLSTTESSNECANVESSADVYVEKQSELSMTSNERLYDRSHDQLATPTDPESQSIAHAEYPPEALIYTEEDNTDTIPFTAASIPTKNQKIHTNSNQELQPSSHLIGQGQKATHEVTAHSGTTHVVTTQLGRNHVVTAHPDGTNSRGSEILAHVNPQVSTPVEGTHVVTLQQVAQLPMAHLDPTTHHVVLSDQHGIPVTVASGRMAVALNPGGVTTDGQQINQWYTMKEEQV